MTAIRNIVVLTGAGISAESGIATFRGPGGLWEGHRVEDVCTPEALARDPELGGPRGAALRVLLYLFGRDEAVRYLRAG